MKIYVEYLESGKEIELNEHESEIMRDIAYWGSKNKGFFGKVTEIINDQEEEFPMTFGVNEYLINGSFDICFWGREETLQRHFPVSEVQTVLLSSKDAEIMEIHLFNGTIYRVENLNK